MIKKLKSTISSNYQKKQIITETWVNSQTNNLVIFLHGAFSSPYKSKTTKILTISSKVLDQGYSVGFYQSARNFSWQNKSSLSFFQFAKLSFKEKSFAQELDDVVKAISEIIKKTKITNKTKRLRITLVGFSLGGIIGCFIAKKFKEVKNIFMFGTGIYFKGYQDLPITNNLPSSNYLGKTLSDYQNKLHLYLGKNDKVVNLPNASKLLNLASNANWKSLTVIKDTDHRFNGKENVIYKNILFHLNQK